MLEPFISTNNKTAGSKLWPVGQI